MLGIRESDTKFLKLDKNIHDIDTVNKTVANTKLIALGAQDEIPNSSEKVAGHAPKE